MDGKFMKIKQIVIPTLTLLLIASQLTGCASTTQKEMLQMINNQEAITIEIAEPLNQEQGTEQELNWKELATLQTYPEFREQFDDILNITAHGTNGKNGIIYVAPDGTHTNNSTLHYAFQNQKFIDNVWNNTETTTQIINAIKSNYIDVETDQHAILASINAYFNIFADTEEGYFNANQTLTRAEFYGGAYRAQNPVAELEQDIEFEMAVDTVGENPDTIFASQMQDKIYLGIESGSLDTVNFNSTITRAEAIYTLVTTYYADEYNTITGKEDCYSDCKNGGNIAKELKFIEQDKATGETTYKKYWQSYELSYALQYPNKGLPTNLYKAMVVAYNHNLIPTNKESNWNDGLTKGDALNLIINVYEDLGTTTNADRGASTGEVVENNQTSIQVNAYESLSQDNIIQLDDGTYDFTDDFLGTVMTYDYFVGSTEQEVKEFLNEAIDEIINEDEGMLNGMFKGLSRNGSTLKSDNELRAEIEQNKENTTGNNSSNSNNNNSNSGNTSGSTTQTTTPTQPSGYTGSSDSDDWDFDNLPPGWEVGGDFGGEYMGNAGDIH